MLDLAYETGVMNRPWWHTLAHFVGGFFAGALLFGAFVALAAGIAFMSVVIFP